MVGSRLDAKQQFGNVFCSFARSYFLKEEEEEAFEVVSVKLCLLNAADRQTDRQTERQTDRRTKQRYEKHESSHSKELLAKKKKG